MDFCPDQCVLVCVCARNNFLLKYFEVNSCESSKNGLVKNIFFYSKLFFLLNLEIIESTAFHQLLSYPDDSFDLIIHDFTGGPCIIPFVHKFKNAQLIIATPFSRSPFLVNTIGGHHHYAYVPHTILSFDTNMTFWQRLINFSFYIIEHL